MSGVEYSGGRVLSCARCGHTWVSRAGARYGVNCHVCGCYVGYKTRRVDRVVDGFKWIGVDEGDGLVYFDTVRGLVVVFRGSPDRYSSRVEMPVGEGGLAGWLRDYHWRVGFRLIAPWVQELRKIGD